MIYYMKPNWEVKKRTEHIWIAVLGNSNGEFSPIFPVNLDSLSAKSSAQAPSRELRESKRENEGKAFVPWLTLCGDWIVLRDLVSRVSVSICICSKPIRLSHLTFNPFSVTWNTFNHMLGLCHCVWLFFNLLHKFFSFFLKWFFLATLLSYFLSIPFLSKHYATFFQFL